MNLPDPKRMKQLQHSSGGGCKSKACIILCCLDSQKIPDRYEWITKLEYNICIVDLKSDIVGIVDDGDGFTLVSPTFQIECGVCKQNPIKDAFCVLGQTLYMFEGRPYKKKHASRKSVFALDLTRTQTLTQRTTKLAKGGPLLKKIGDMTFPKSSPAALPTPEGKKIVVFSECECTFELFDPANRSWEQLPSIARLKQVYHSIAAYGFVQGSHKLVVQTEYNGGGFYALDLASSADDRRWVKLGTIYSGVDRLPPGCCSHFELVEESRFCIVSSGGFHDLEEYVGEYGRDDVCTYSVFGPPGREGGGCYAARLSYGNENNKGECDFCHMVMESPPSHSSETTQTCRATIDVCRVDLKSYKGMADQLSLRYLRWSRELKHSKTTLVKTLRFSVGFEGTRELCGAHLFFTF